MPCFVCDRCQDTLKKAKLDEHSQRRCRGTTFSCIDCGVTFSGTAYRAHTSCVSEEQKYQKSVYKPKQQAPEPPSKKPKIERADEPAPQPPDIDVATAIVDCFRQALSGEGGEECTLASAESAAWQMFNAARPDPELSRKDVLKLLRSHVRVRRKGAKFLLQM